MNLSTSVISGFDIIGDIHGHAGALHELLHHLGYRRRGEDWLHPAARRAIFVGDFVHGGGQASAVLTTIRAMTDGGNAMAVLGNHEAALLHHYTTGCNGLPFRPLNARQWRVHQESLGLYCERNPLPWEEWLRWLRTLPLWLDLGDIRVVHACWHEPSMAHFPARRLDVAALRFTASDEVARAALDVLLKGPTVPSLQGRDERPVRLNWWQPARGQIRLSDVNLRDLAVGAFASILQPEDHSYGYPVDAPVLFIGHYNHLGNHEAALLAPNIVCVDHGIKDGGNLVAYRWSPGMTVNPNAFLRLP